jgi:TM2 domain-containing membrane protein YozV
LTLLFFSIKEEIRNHRGEERVVKRSPIVAGLLSVLIPGLGQIYGGKGFRGGMLIAAAIVIGNLNIIILPLVALVNPALPGGGESSAGDWAYWIPRIVHDVVSVWSVAFWVWVVVDAVMIVKEKIRLSESS